MPIRTLLALFAIVSLVLGAVPAARAQEPQPDIDPAAATAVAQQGEARVIVELTEPPLRASEVRDRAALRARVRGAADRVLATLPAREFALTYRFEGVPGFAGTVDADGLARLGADPRVRSVTLDGIGEGAMNESLPLINADDVRDSLGFTGAGVVVAVLDSGADLDHPDFAGAIAYEECWLLTGCPGGGQHTSGPGSAEDDHGHGTHVSSTIAGRGAVAPKGIAPGAQIAAYKILASNNQGYFSDWLAALDDILANHPEVDIVNMSLVDSVNHGGACDSYQPLTTSTINALRTAGTVTVVSSGNNGYTNGMTFPACVSSALSVGAVWDYNGGAVNFLGCTEAPVVDRPTCFSNSAADLDLLAPGAFILASRLGGGTATFGGTSMAAPHVAGVAAQMFDAVPSLTVTQIETALESTGVPRVDPKNGLSKPRIDALAAVTSITDDDGDGVPAAADNCPSAANSGQQNNDGNVIDLPGKAYDDVTMPYSDALGDACDPDDDNDGRSDADETSGASCAFGVAITDPMKRDSDGDNALDGAECAIGTNPNSSASAPTLAQCGPNTDADGDGLLASREVCYYNTDPANPNTDGDNCGDGREAASINGNFAVDIIDIQQAATEFGRYNPPGSVVQVNFDITKDRAINIIDLQQIAARAGPC